MDNFTFCSPTLFAFGDGQENKIGTFIRQFGGSKVLLAYGNRSAKHNGAYDAVTNILRQSQIPYVELSGIQANPLSGKVYEGIALARAENIDFLLALGGGSVIDTVKAIGIGMKYDGDFWDFFRGSATIKETIPVGVISTLAAAGSEGSDACVIVQEDENIKCGCPKTDILRPKFAIMNPKYTYTVSVYQTACGVADMFAHICERYFTNTSDVILTDRLCEALLKTIVEAAKTVQIDGENYAARADLMWASILGQNNSCGVGRQQDWSSHQIEHELYAQYHSSHGAGLAIILPAWMEYVMAHAPMRFARFAVEVFGCEMNYAHPQDTAREGIAHLRAFFREMGLPSTLAELGGKPEDISILVTNRAYSSGGFPFGNFVKIGSSEMVEILLSCME